MSQVLQTGYDLFGRVVRPAMVVVAAKDSTGPAPETASAEAAEDCGPRSRQSFELLRGNFLHRFGGPPRRGGERGYNNRSLPPLGGKYGEAG